VSEHCSECGRVYGDGGVGDPTDRVYYALTEARLLAELWIRSSDQATKVHGADLKQVLSDAPA
jgi:hypothetical protein